MAIKDMKGTISTTGMVNQRPPKIQAPDMSKMKMPTNRTVNTPREVAKKPVEQPKQSNLIDKIQNLTDQDKAVLGTVLSPSVSKVLAKIAPDLNPLLTQFTKDEENVILPVSVVKNFAARKYGGTEEESVQSFVADLTGQMDQQPVPPDTEMVQNQEPESGINYDAIDSDAMTIS